MAYRCENCGKGVAHGHMVSHAKNRLHRLFKPNLQKLKVFKNGILIRVKFCTSCIQRLKKYNRLGVYLLGKPVASIKVSLSQAPKKIKVEKVKPKLKVKEEKSVPTLDISQIVGKKS